MSLFSILKKHKFYAETTLLIRKSRSHAIFSFIIQKTFAKLRRFLLFRIESFRKRKFPFLPENAETQEHNATEQSRKIEKNSSRQKHGGSYQRFGKYSRIKLQCDRFRYAYTAGNGKRIDGERRRDLRREQCKERSILSRQRFDCKKSDRKCRYALKKNARSHFTGDGRMFENIVSAFAVALHHVRKAEKPLFNDIAPFSFKKLTISSCFFAFFPIFSSFVK